MWIQLFKGIASEADALLNDLQSSLHSQEEKLASFAQQQREVCNSYLVFQLMLFPVLSNLLKFRCMLGLNTETGTF